MFSHLEARERIFLCLLAEGKPQAAVRSEVFVRDAQDPITLFTITGFAVELYELLRRSHSDEPFIINDTEELRSTSRCPILSSTACRLLKVTFLLSLGAFG